MNTNQAKKIVAGVLQEHGFSNKLTARTISFTDLARGNKIFIKIHDWKPNSVWDEIKKKAGEYGFCIEI